MSRWKAARRWCGGLAGGLLVMLAVTGCVSVAAPRTAAAPAAKATAGDSAEKSETVAAKIAGFERLDGMLTLYRDAKAGKLWLELPAPSSEADGAKAGEVGTFLYYAGVRSGLGSNPVGIDRGQLSDGSVVTLRRLGGRLLIEEQNLRFRALSDDAEERDAVRESFATSVLWAGKLETVDDDGRALVDLTPFLLRDAHNVASTLLRTGQGEFKLDAERSAVDLAACRAFPDNLELESLLTFGSDKPGELVRATAPSGRAVTFVQHQSLVRLPDDGYQPRAFDPRAGSFAIRFLDYAAPLDAPLEKRWIVRHRLEKTDPTAARSTVVKPIVYYLDRGTPEPVRSALIEGASWWAKAFEAAGFLDAYRVELLPEGADPLDARYNVIQWVHRSTRGWSYGGGLTDPRTGERIQGHVWLGSLRVRQDRLLFEGLAGTADSGSGAADDPVELALARIRQLAAHEVGHALGFNHNFAASTYDGRASVMDYPAPLIGIDGDRLDFSQAYGVGVGNWDVHAVRYAYSQFEPGADEAAELERIARQAEERDLYFISDADARPLGSSHPRAHLWDNGEEAAAALEHTWRVRHLALERFAADRVAAGQPLALLEEVLATVYFHHRYQLEAAVKLIGGVDYRYALRPQDGSEPPAAELARSVPADQQRHALAALLATLDPAELDLPESVLALLLPRPVEYDGNPEMFVGRATAPGFDALGAARTAAAATVEGLLHRERAARLVDQHRRDPSLPGLTAVEEALLGRVFAAPQGGDRLAEVALAVRTAAVEGLLTLAADPQATPAVRARTEAVLQRLSERLRAAPSGGSSTSASASATDAQHAWIQAEIERFLDRDRPPMAPTAAAAELPPGSPIGSPIGSGPPMPALGWGGCSMEEWSGWN